MNTEMMKFSEHPLLRPAVELKCPACGAEAEMFLADYGAASYVESYNCECRWSLPQLPYSEQLLQLQRVFASRVHVWNRLGQDYRDMAQRNYRLATYNREAVQNLRSVEAGSQVYLHGPGGGGKTHLVIKAIIEILNRGLSVEYWSETAFFDEAREYALSRASLRVKPGRRGDILILEDVGKTKASEYAAQMFYDVLEFRTSNRLGLIITSNHSPKEAANRLVVDPHNAGAVESRLKAGSVIELLSPRDGREGSFVCQN